MPVTINGTSGVTTPALNTSAGTANFDSLSTASNALSAVNSMGFRNRIINGGMVIDQRNAGAAVTLAASPAYGVDRWGGFEDTDGAMTAQQSSVAPPGFTNSLLLTTTTADSSLAATQYASLAQTIEGFNTADLGWGTSSAQTVTVSFWVRSSLTGAFGGSLTNQSFNRGYIFSYTINSANTWEYKTITIPGDTTGTWNTTNLRGIQLNFGLGVGSAYSGTAGVWGSGVLLAPTGATSVVGTLNATWQITGVQLEAGSVATPFERRPYGTELALCQRYFEKSYAIGTAPGTATSLGMKASAGFTGSTTTAYLVDGFQYRVIKRANPTVVFYDSAGTPGRINTTSVGVSSASNQVALLGGESNEATVTVVRETGGTAANALAWHFTASAEL